VTDTASTTVLYEVTDGLALVTLNRPDRANGWTPTMQRELFAILETAGDDPDVRAIVLTGAGRAFCGGADMDVLATADEDEAESSRPLLAPMWNPKPIVAAINGACAGIGLQLALMSDVRIAATEAKFTTAFARRGLIAEHGLTWLLPRLTTLAVATDLLVSGRVFTGEEAQRLGVVQRDVPRDQVLEQAIAYARDLVDNVSPTAMAVIKWQMYHHRDLDLLDSIDHSDQLMVESINRPDLAEGVASFVERRQPHFPPVDRSAVPPATGAFRSTATGAV